MTLDALDIYAPESGYNVGSVVVEIKYEGVILTPAEARQLSVKLAEMATFAESQLRHIAGQTVEPTKEVGNG